MCNISLKLAILCLVPQYLTLGGIQDFAPFNANAPSCIVYSLFKSTFLVMAQSQQKILG